MVGDGIRNVTLRSPKPLNDNEWHYVEAEINVKMARLKVDFLPPALHKFPGQTYITMKFTQPLLVGKNHRAGVSSRDNMKTLLQAVDTKTHHASEFRCGQSHLKAFPGLSAWAEDERGACGFGGEG